MPCTAAEIIFAVASSQLLASPSDDDFSDLSDDLWDEAGVDVDTPPPESDDAEAADDAPDSSAGDDSSAKKRSYENPFTGNFRLLGGFLHFPDLPPPLPTEDDALVAVVGRLIARQTLGWFTTEFNMFAEVTRLTSAQLSGAFTTAGATESVYRVPGLQWEFWDDGSVAGRMGVDRFALRFRRGRWSMAMGRFPVNHSIAFIFTPNDWFAPFSATTVNKIYKPGVDAIQMGVNLTGLSSVDVTAVLGYGDDTLPSWGRAAVVARAATVQWGFEWAVMGGKLAERWMAGASLQGDVGPIGIRGEGHVGILDANGDGRLDDAKDPHVRLSAGPNLNLPWKSATIAAEYGFWSDGAGEPEDYLQRATAFFPDDLPYLGRHYVGLQAGMELIPILRADALAFVNAGDGSGLVGAFLAYSVSDEADLAAGTFVPWGRSPVADGPLPRLRSEYGVAGLTLFLEARVFF